MILATHGIVGSQIVQIVPEFEFSVKTNNSGVSTSTQFRMPLTTSTGLDFDVDWGDGTVENITNHTLAIHDYGTAGTYTIKVTGSILGWQFNDGGDKQKLLNISKFGALNISVSRAFYGCSNMTSNATDRPKITQSNLERTFQNCPNFNNNISNWNMSDVTNLGLFFGGCSNFNQDISNWDISNVTNLFGCFFNCTNFNQDIGSWNTSKVTLLSNFAIGCFRGCTNFNQDLSNWDINQVTDFDNFMLGVTLSTANYDALLVAWEAQAPLTGKSINFGGSKYTLLSAAATARASLIATYGWTITDGGGI